MTTQEMVSMDNLKKQLLMAVGMYSHTLHVSGALLDTCKWKIIQFNVDLQIQLYDIRAGAF